MINDENKKQILDSFIENIACISDEKYQKRVWVQGEGPECDDIDDTICDFFDEDYILEKYKEFGITENQYQLLMKLHKKLRKFTDTFGVYSPEKSTEKLVQLPEWQEIRGISKNILKAFSPSFELAEVFYPEEEVMPSQELVSKDINKQIESIEIATDILEFSYRLQFLSPEILQHLFASKYQVKQVMLIAKSLTLKEIENFLFNHLHSTICSFWISIDEAFDGVFGSKQSEDCSFLNSFRVIIYMFRCAFSHEISEPIWFVKQQYRKQYRLEIPKECSEGGVECFEFDFAILHGQNVQTASIGGLAGLKTLANIARKLLIDQQS